jgi:hypothetical protein
VIAIELFVVIVGGTFLANYWEKKSEIRREQDHERMMGFIKSKAKKT